MKSIKSRQLLAILAAVLTSGLASNAQSQNLLQNPNADRGAALWRAFGDATIETANGNPFFVVRNGGYFFQDVELADNAAGQYVVFVGYGSSERINHDRGITGLPYLYGYMMADQRKSNGDKILAYLQGQRMLASTTLKDEWVNLSGVFKVPEGTKRVRFFLNQALQNGVPHNGSAARFDNLELRLFATKEEAESFVAYR